jgi:hypothetical protein
MRPMFARMWRELPVGTVTLPFTTSRALLDSSKGWDTRSKLDAKRSRQSFGS